MTKPAPATDYMRDELVDAGIGFDADELEACQNGSAVAPRADDRAR